jgi:hypothetical protein
VLIIIGPIASGKSTVAQALAADCRAAGANAVVIDLDRMFMMLDDGPVMSDAEMSRRARRATAALVDHYVLDELDLIIAEGDFWTRGQRDEFTCRLTSGIAPSGRPRGYFPEAWPNRGSIEARAAGPLEKVRHP